MRRSAAARPMMMETKTLTYSQTDMGIPPPRHPQFEVCRYKALMSTLAGWCDRAWGVRQHVCRLAETLRPLIESDVIGRAGYPRLRPGRHKRTRRHAGDHVRRGGRRVHLLDGERSVRRPLETRCLQEHDRR